MQSSTYIGSDESNRSLKLIFHTPLVAT